MAVRRASRAWSPWQNAPGAGRLKSEDGLQGKWVNPMPPPPTGGGRHPVAIQDHTTAGAREGWESVADSTRAADIEGPEGDGRRYRTISGLARDVRGLRQDSVSPDRVYSSRGRRGTPVKPIQLTGMVGRLRKILTAEDFDSISLSLCSPKEKWAREGRSKYLRRTKRP